MVSIITGGVKDERGSLDGGNRVILFVIFEGLHVAGADDFFFEFDKSSGLSAEKKWIINEERLVNTASTN